MGKRTPVESFGPELMAALLKGAQERFEIKTTWRRAITFRRRVYQLRERMREEKHPLYPNAALCRIQITWDQNTPVKRSGKNVPYPASTDAPVTLVLSPYDSEFKEELTKAGIKVEPQEPIIPQPGASPASQQLQDFLSEFVQDKPGGAK